MVYIYISSSKDAVHFLNFWFPPCSREAALDRAKVFFCAVPQGTPEIKEHYIDSKKDVDRHLKFSCEQFIQQQTQIFVGNLEEFLTKVTVRAKADSAWGGDGSSWPSNVIYCKALFKSDLLSLLTESLCIYMAR